MKKLLLLFVVSCASLGFGQGVIVAPQTAFKVVNGLTSPIANATITVCAANASGIPCSPALATSIFKDAALTIPLSNPFFSDSTGNYQFAIAPGNYTITVTNSGFNGQSYQMTVATPISLASGLADPGANGVIFRNGLNTTRPAVSADVIALFSGSCSVSTFIRGDGSCAAVGGVTSFNGRTGAVLPAANDYTFDQIGAGSNLTAHSMGNAGSLKPVNLGQIAGNQAWLQPGLVVPATTGTLAGGSIGAGHSWLIQYTLNTALGETLPSVLLSAGMSALTGATCTSGGACTLTITAPTLPSGYTSWNAYVCDTSAGLGCSAPLKLAACTALGAGVNCTMTAPQGSAGSALPTTNTAIIQPPNVQATNGPAGFIPSVFFPKADGNYYPWLGVEWNSCDAVAGPPPPCGTPMFTHRTYFNDNPANTPVGGKHSFIVMDHLAGIGTTTTAQDRTLWVNWANPVNDAATRYAAEGIQVELDFNCNGCSINGSPDAEVTAGSYQLSTAGASTNWATNGYNTNAIQSRVFRSGAGFDGQGINAVYGNVANSNVTASAGSVLSGLKSAFDGIVNAPNIRGVGLRIVGPATTSRFGFNDGIFSTANFTPAAGLGAADNFIDQRTHNWNSLLNGAVGLTSIENTDGATQALPINASVNNTGSLTVSQIATGWTSTASVSCLTGASTYTYQLVAVDGNGGQVPAGGTFNCNTGTNPLAGGTPATINPTGAMSTSAVIRQAVRIDIYRTGGPMSTGKIGSFTCNNDLPINGCSAFSDTGIAAVGTVPTTNTTGGATVTGYLHSSLNTVQLASDFTSAVNTNLQTIGVLTWNLDASAKKYSFHCSLMYSQATAAVAMQFGIQAATVNPTDISAKGRVDTSTSAQTSGVLSNLATTTATSIVTFTPSATATVFGADLDGSIDNPANNQGQVVNIMVQTSNSADLPTVKRGSYCTLY